MEFQILYSLVFEFSNHQLLHFLLLFTFHSPRVFLIYQATSCYPYQEKLELGIRRRLTVEIFKITSITYPFPTTVFSTFLFFFKFAVAGFFSSFSNIFSLFYLVLIYLFPTLSSPSCIYIISVSKQSSKNTSVPLAI